MEIQYGNRIAWLDAQTRLLDQQNERKNFVCNQKESYISVHPMREVRCIPALGRLKMQGVAGVSGQERGAEFLGSFDRQQIRTASPRGMAARISDIEVIRNPGRRGLGSSCRDESRGA